MLRPARMKKIVVIGLNEDRDRVLTVLHDLKAVQVEPVSKGVNAYFAAEKGAQMERSVAAEAQRFKALVAALPPVPVTERASFPTTEALLAATSTVTIDAQVRDLKRREDELLTREENLRDVKEVLEEFSFFNEDLGVLLARSIYSFFSTVGAEHYPEFEREVRALSPDAYLSSPQPSTDGKHYRVVVIVPREKAEAFAKLTSKYGARLMAVPSEFKGTPRTALAEVGARMSEVTTEIGRIRAELLQISREWYPRILPIEEELIVEARKAEVAGRLGRSQSGFALEGWIPERDIPRLNAALRQATGDRHHVIVTEEHEGAPTLLVNPKGFSLFEFFIKFYSLPQSGEIDPTIIFSIVFPIFFGLMLGDAGYGLFILGLALWLIWRIGNPNAGPTWVPKSLVKFVTVIVPPWAIKALAKMLVPCAIFATVLGVLFDQYFGRTLSELTLGHVSFPAVFTYNPMDHVGQLLLISGYLGLAMVSLGLIFGMINAYFEQKWKHLTGKFAWLVLAWGVSLVGLTLIRNGATEHLAAILPPPNLLVDVYWIMIAFAIPTIIVTEGPLAAVELPTIVSHVLSYTRLIGILFSSVILAYVIDYLAAPMIWSPTGSTLAKAGALIGGVVLLLFGQGFNIVLGIFEPSIQGIRLIYVEHFSKYYTGNGKAFVPFGATRRYTRPQLLESHTELRG